MQSFRIEGLRASLFKEYARLLFGDTDREATILSLARPLAKFMGDLPDFAASTKNVSATAQNVRSAFHLAKSPQTLLFEQLPQACGLSRIQGMQSDSRQLKTFAETLRGALRELQNAYPELIAHFNKLLGQAFNLGHITSLGEFRGVLRSRLEGLDSYTIDADGLRAFIRRVIKAGGDDEGWFSNLLLFLGQKPSRKWTDADAEAAEFRLAEFARRIHDLDKLRVHYDGERQKRDVDFEVLLLRAVRKGASEHDEVVCIDAPTRAAITSARASVESTLAELQDRKLKLALLAELADELLAGKVATERPQLKMSEDGKLVLIRGGNHG